jgi:hypothetical protein
MMPIGGVFLCDGKFVISQAATFLVSTILHRANAIAIVDLHEVDQAAC